MSNDDLNRHQLNKTGFWGKAGAGSIIMARTTGKLLIQKRSASVEEPGTWGTWGGAIDQGLNPEDAALREFEQETGKARDDVRDVIPLYIFKHESGFKYYNFLFTVDDEFTPDLNWEVDGFEWIVYGHWPEPLHFGLEKLIQHDGSKIKEIIRKNSLGQKLTEHKCIYIRH
jgi:8-oxo-dGTP pyrophosphatase MutT (NUDIX family)